MWFSKKNEEKTNTSALPELPELPELPQQFPESSNRQLSPIPPAKSPTPPARAFQIKENISSLPSFPNSDTGNKISREAIKSALSTEKQNKPYTQEIPSGLKEVRMKEENPDFGTSMRVSMPAARVVERDSSPIFVRIDKFQTSVKSLNEIKKQISQIENYLAEIKAVKSKEEHELSEWEHEILEIKSKLESIDKTLFSKLG